MVEWSNIRADGSPRIGSNPDRRDRQSPAQLIGPSALFILDCGSNPSNHKLLTPPPPDPPPQK